MKAVVRTIQPVAVPSPEIVNNHNISDGEYSNPVPSTSAVNMNPNELTTAQHLKLAIRIVYNMSTIDYASVTSHNQL